LEAGGDIRLLSKALGNSSITVTGKFYAHFTTKQQDLLEQAVEKALAALGD
jgi:type IV secretory pathway TrbL component